MATQPTGWLAQNNRMGPGSAFREAAASSRLTDVHVRSFAHDRERVERSSQRYLVSVRSLWPDYARLRGSGLVLEADYAARYLGSAKMARLSVLH